MTGQWDDTARLATTGLTAEANGNWHNVGEALEVVYHAGRSPITIPITSTSTWKGHTVAANHAWDTTKEVPGNAIGRPLLGTAGLHLAANETRKVLIEYDRPSLADGDRPGLDDEVTINVPMPGGTVPVRFRAAGE